MEGEGKGAGRGKGNGASRGRGVAENLVTGIAKDRRANKKSTQDVIASDSRSIRSIDNSSIPASSPSARRKRGLVSGKQAVSPLGGSIFKNIAVSDVKVRTLWRYT